MISINSNSALFEASSCGKNQVFIVQKTPKNCLPSKGEGGQFFHKRTTYMKGKVFPYDTGGGSCTMSSNKCHIDLVDELKCDYHSIELGL